MTQQLQERIKAAKMGDRFAVGETRPRQGDCGAMYYVLRTEQGWEVRETPHDRTGLSLEVSIHPSYNTAQSAARKLCTMLYR